MGIKIHYRGKLDKPGLIDPICRELKDISDEMGWKYIFINEDLYGPNTSYIADKGHIKGTVPLKGVIIKVHKDAESLSLLFDKNGYIRNMVGLALSKKEVPAKDVCSIKTQFAPVEIHISVVKLLKYLKKKYINNLYVFDEGSYWETEDRVLLSQKIDFLNMKMDELEGILNDIETDENDTKETVIAKIEGVLKKRYGKTVQIKKSKK